MADEEFAPQVEDQATIDALERAPEYESDTEPESADDKAKRAKADEDYIINTERECALLLLEARWLLGQMILARETLDENALRELRRRREEEAKASGNLSVSEIMALLQASPDDDNEDWISRIQELKRQLAIEIRRNHVLDRDLQKLDKRIALLIKSRDPKFIQQTLNMKLKSQKKKKQQDPNAEVKKDFAHDTKKLEHYQDLFYLMQTEPRYLAKTLYMVQSDVMESFMETTILTLFGEAFSPREELLVLKLFQKAIQVEINVIKNVGDFLTAESVVPKMVVTYNRRKLGIEYLRTVLAPVLNGVIKRDDLNLELNPLLIYQQMISEMEIKTGEKSNLERNVSEETALKNPEVKSILEKRVADLTDVCELFLEGIIGSLPKLPYGLRWICKQIHVSCKKSLPDCSPEDILRLTGYFVYYRFINLAIVTPDAYNIVDRELSGASRKNLVVVAKVLQYLFNLKSFGNSEKYMVPLNSMIASKQDTIVEYFNTLVQVDEPEDALEVNKYMELTQKTKPVIYISLHEIASTHKLLVDNLSELAPEKDDPLRIILNDLGDAPPMVDEADDREIQLTLNNRFKVDMEEDSEAVRLYAETKELVIPILRTVPILNSIVRLNLMDILESGIKFATETTNKQLSTQINKVLENIQKLEAEGMMSKNDNYESFVHDIALEVANRAVIREQQKKEIARLTGTLESLQKHSQYINEQIVDYTKYLNDCREHYQPRKKGKVKKKVGPFKFSYKDLAKQGVIIESEVPSLSRKGTAFIISSESIGIFDIEAKIASVSVEKMQIELDDLLDRHHNHVQRLELDQVTLDVNMTLHLLNKHFKIMS